MERGNFEDRLLAEIHGMREDIVRLETRLEHLLEIRIEVSSLKKKIQEIEVEQAIQKTKLWGIGTAAGVIVSVVVNWIMK